MKNATKTNATATATSKTTKPVAEKTETKVTTPVNPEAMAYECWAKAIKNPQLEKETIVFVAFTKSTYITFGAYAEVISRKLMTACPTNKKLPAEAQQHTVITDNMLVNNWKKLVGNVCNEIALVNDLSKPNDIQRLWLFIEGQTPATVKFNDNKTTIQVGKERKLPKVKTPKAEKPKAEIIGYRIRFQLDSKLHNWLKVTKAEKQTALDEATKFLKGKYAKVGKIEIREMTAVEFELLSVK